MDRKLFGVLSGTQVTILGALAIITPGAVYAVTYSPVAIVDPLSGHQAAVDASRRLYVYDPVAGYANNPSNLLEISGSTAFDQNVVRVVYTVPAGKALILKSAQMTFFNGVSGADNSTYFFDGGGGDYFAGFDDPNVYGSHSANLGSGWYFKSGETIEFYSSVPTVFSLEGYMVPSTAIPSSGDGAPQKVNFGRLPPKKM